MGHEKVGLILDSLAIIERCLDWGVSGDTCLQCAETKSIGGLVALFNQLSGEADDNVASVIADRRLRCAKCLAERP